MAYNFVSPGATVASSLMDLLVQRKAEDRQRMLDELTAQRVQADIDSAATGRQLQRDQFEYLQRRDVAEDDFRNTQARQAAAERLSAADAQRAFQAEQNEASRQARAEQAQHDRELRELIARMSASNSNDSKALANELKRIQIQQARDKLDTARTDRDNANKARQQGRSEVYGLAQVLLNDPTLNRAAGPIDAMLPTVRPSTRDYQNRLERLKNLLTFENRSKLKGQGAISDAETRMLERAASAIDLGAGEEAVRRELERIMSATGSGSASPIEPASQPEPAVRNLNDLRQRYGY